MNELRMLVTRRREAINWLHAARAVNTFARVPHGTVQGIHGSP